jgi:hypothetical protein
MNPLCLICNRAKATKTYNYMPICEVCYNKMKERQTQLQLETKQIKEGKNE